MQDFIVFCLTPLLSHPDELSVIIDENLISLKVNPEDTGRVIGRGGSIINALRSLCTAYCANNNLPSVQITLVD
ncbi:MAG: KH domain-containing protein [Patescibacteria group bacterium]